METYIYASMLRELTRFRRIFAWVLIALAGVGMAALCRNLIASGSPADAYILLSDAFAFRVLPLAAAILSMAVISQEVEQKTIVYLLTRPIPRWQLILFRAAAAMTVTFAISALTLAILAASTSGLTNGVFLRDLVAAAVGSAAYVSLFVLVSLLINKSMIVCILFAFVWESTAPLIPGDLYRLTITGYLQGISQHPSVGTGNQDLMDSISNVLGTHQAAQWLSYVSMAILIAACLAASCYWFSTNEYMAREDS